MGDGASGYSRNFDPSEIESLNKLAELQETTQETKDAVDSIKEKTGILDVIGGYFSAAYSAFKTAFTSIDTYFELTGDALDLISIGDPSSASILQSGLTIIAIIIIFIAIGISAIMKWDV
jgi:hypothetical protein